MTVTLVEREKLTQSLRALYARVPLGMRLGLQAMESACAMFEHPERAFEVVHVAGTNGKGSVCAMTESIARASGKKTGLYTSPHLCRFAERIQINGTPIDDSLLSSLLDHVLHGAPDLSFFEAATMTAFMAFREANVDMAVVEVGIGGRLDATNVIPAPRASAITRIALDHTDRLGDTLFDIAREKAGIAKPGAEIVLGRMPSDVADVIAACAASRGASVVRWDDSAARDFAARGLPIGLAGEHQKDNAFVADALGKRLGASEVERQKGIARATWPGRLESIEKHGTVYLLDAAHNPDGAASLVHHVESLGIPAESRALIFGALADKDWRPMIDALAPLVPVAEHRYYVSPKGRAAVEPSEIAARHAGTHSSAEDALESAAKSGLVPVRLVRLVIVCGSIYLVGEARARLLELETDPPVAL